MDYYSLEYLPKANFGFLNNNDNNYRKYIANLFNTSQDKKPQNTDGWLVPKKLLKINNKSNGEMISGDVLIESDLFIKKKTVVVKISTNEKLLTQDFESSKKLNGIKCSNFSKYLGLFSCKDNIKNYSKTYPLPEHFCKKEGDINYFLFMPYYKLGSLVQYEPENIDQIISIINQVICSNYIAFQKLGFLHNDLHLGNILIKPTSKTNLTYNFNEGSRNILSHGIEIIIFDFDRSTFNNNRFEMFLSQIMALINIYKIRLMEFEQWKNINFKDLYKNLYKITDSKSLLQFIGE